MKTTPKPLRDDDAEVDAVKTFEAALHDDTQQ